MIELVLREDLKFALSVFFPVWSKGLIIADIFVDFNYAVILDESKIKSDFFFYSFDVAVVFDTSF